MDTSTGRLPAVCRFALLPQATRPPARPSTYPQGTSPGPGADVAGASPGPGADVAGVSPGPGADVAAARVQTDRHGDGLLHQRGERGLVLLDQRDYLRVLLARPLRGPVVRMHGYGSEGIYS